jgi:hypothetical protein
MVTKNIYHMVKESMETNIIIKQEEKEELLICCGPTPKYK